MPMHLALHHMPMPDGMTGTCLIMREKVYFPQTLIAKITRTESTRHLVIVIVESHLALDTCTK